VSLFYLPTQQALSSLGDLVTIAFLTFVKITVSLSLNRFLSNLSVNNLV